MKLARKIRNLRKEKGWILEELAHKTGVSISYLSKVEARGEIPSPEMLVLLTVMLDGNVKELFKLAVKEKTEQLCNIISRNYNLREMQYYAI